MQAPPRSPVVAFRERLIFRTNFMTNGWRLHPQLNRDTASLGDLPLSRVLVINDANYPWLLLVPRQPDITEVIDLDEVEQAQLMTEVTRVARALRHVTACHKL